MEEKVQERGSLANLLRELRRNGRRVVFTNGCFDLLHVGHLRYLEKAKTLGDLLVVGVNSDDSVREIKGPRRPILPLRERMELLAGLACVDYVTSFDEPTPLGLITLLKPDVLAKGGDWTPETTVGRETVEQSGGRVVILPYIEGTSTSHLIDIICRRYADRN